MFIPLNIEKEVQPLRAAESVGKKSESLILVQDN